MNGFNSLNLTNVETEGAARLKTGVHDVVVGEAEFRANKAGTGSLVAVKLTSTETGACQLVSFNVQHQNPEAQKIGQKQLKTFLIAAAHPNPNNPGDIRSLNGLRLKLVVEENGTYRGSDGKDYPSFEPAKRGAYLPLERTALVQTQGDQDAFQKMQPFQ
jgi:hypothetical protein